jgi:hypothetical protein
MWLLAVDGGQPRRVNIDAKAISAFRFNPKTWQIVYGPSNAPSFEVRRMENFLPVQATDGNQRPIANEVVSHPRYDRTRGPMFSCPVRCRDS